LNGISQQLRFQAGSGNRDRRETAYFESHTKRMRYPAFRRHLFVGAGVSEACCKTVIGSRYEQSAMFCIVRGADAIIDLRCCRINGQFEDHWENRAA